ncbi:MAG: sigma-70 family RNA polymerase sigma factor, partial [Oscillospiraceae bacterium]|nr:sigma-70 family RNA polymerase sigma factor [Oscillospiraceae bacterium]
LSVFLGKIARNEAISRRRTAAAEKRGSGEVPLVLDEMAEIISDGSTVEREHEYKELMNEISAFLRKQPPLKRDLFVCRYWYCMSVRELSEKFGVSESKATVTLCRTRAKLKEYLRKRGYDI